MLHFSLPLPPLHCKFRLSFLKYSPRYTLTLSSRQHKRDLKFEYGADKVRGVNLGGWFVLEPWITPSIFEPWATSGNVVDEYTLTQTLGKAQAQSTLSAHWNTWITESDFEQIAAAGLNHVRIPIGYWSVAPIDGEPYVQGAYDVLNTALGWAQNHGIMVWIDLHGGELLRPLPLEPLLTDHQHLARKMGSTTLDEKAASRGLKARLLPRRTPL